MTDKMIDDLTTKMTTSPTITARDIRIGLWRERDGSSYRAAYVNECVLTLPEHAGLPDDALRAEAIAEAKRAEIYRDDDDAR
jgi:hypothetical protein